MTDTPIAANNPWTPAPPAPRAPVMQGDNANRSFLRKAWGVLVAIKDGLALLFLLMFFVLLFGLLAARPNGNVAVSEGALLIDLDGVVSEQPADIDPFALLSGSAPVPEYRLRDVVHAITTAATDDRVSAVVLNLDGFMGAGQVALGDIGAAMDKVRAAKKPVLTYATGYADDGYMLAAHASEVWMNPVGGAVIAGPGGSNLYYKGLLDKLGVTANVYRVGTFKSAVEPFIRNDQSPEAKEATMAYASVLWDQWLADVKKARPKAKIDAFIADPAAAARANGNDLAKAALANGLVDKLGDDLAFGRRVAEIAGAEYDEQPWTFNTIPLDTWVAANPPEENGDAIAVIPVVGEIVDGETPNGLAGGDTVAQYILDAASDDSIKAIVLRVDSPGGSVLASEKIRQALLQAKARKLPIVVSMANVAASGGYWVATPADKIFAEPDTITGSIGVFAVLPSFEKSLEKIGINADGVATTPLSGQPDVMGGISPQFNELAQVSVEHIYARFTGLVAKSRKQPIDKILPIAEGRVWAGGTARQLGLVDAFGGIDAALAEAAKLAKLEDGAFYPVYFEQMPDAFSQMIAGLVSGESEEQARTGARGWMGLAMGRREAAMAQVARDLSLLSGGASMQASCLECRGYRPFTANVRDAEAQGWLAALAKLAG